MKEILFLEPVFKTAIWGGNKLSTDFGYELPEGKIGECWAISAHDHGDCRIKNGSYQGETLKGLWSKHRELFGNLEGDRFPLLVKIIDADKDLSIQVHPDDEYAFKYENGSLGKSECWYILDCEPDAEIVIGHNAKDKEELKRMIAEKRWTDLIRLQKLHKGDFFQINPGTVHAIKAGTLLLETQQSSDVTYRLYDYDRLDNGKLRELHIDKSIDVIKCPHEDSICQSELKTGENYDTQLLIKSEHYTVERLLLHGEQTFIQDKPFLNVSIIQGSGSIDGVAIKKGDHFILPYGYGKYLLSGNMELITSTV